MRRAIHNLPLFILFIVLSSSAYAGRLTPADQLCAPVTGSGQDVKLGFGGKPVSLLSGIEYFTRTDLSIGSAFPITITRSYDSSSGYDSPIGYGWGINYDKRLYTYPDGSVTVRKDCGGRTRFTWSISGYTSSAGDASTLVQNADGTYTFTDKFGQTDNYDVQGRIASTTAITGNSLIFTYAALTRDPLWGLLLSNVNQNNPLIIAYDYRLEKVEEKNTSGNLTGNWVEFHYDSYTGRLTDITDNLGRTVSYGHDDIGNLIAVSGPSGSSSYQYSDPTSRHLISTIDEGQGPYINAYDSMGRVSRQTHGTDTIDFAYTTPFQQTTITTTIRDGAGNVLNTQSRTVDFDDSGVIIKATDTFGNITTYLRDNNTSWILQEGHTDVSTGVTTTATYTYDGKGNALTRTEALGTSIEKTTTYTYHPVFNLVTTETVTSVVDPAQARVITNAYDDANGNLLTTTETGLLGDGTPYSYTTAYTYYPDGKIQTIDGPRTDVSDVTTYYYDPITGYQNGVDQPIIGTTAYSNFDPLGNPQTVTDPNGNVTNYTYDSIGRVTSVKAPGDTNQTQYFYVSGGCQSCGGANKIDHITLPEGNTIWYTYDSMGNLTTITDSQNNTINYAYDSAGNKLSEQIKDSSGALQKTLSYEYDALNRLMKVINTDSTFNQYTYDFRNNRISAKDPNGNTTNYSYEALNRLAMVIQPGAITTAYGYDTNNNLTSVTDANNNTTSYRYDDKGRVYQTISPDTGTTTYAYDPAGNMISKTDAKGVTISYQYDAANRLTKIDFPTDTDTIYSYDSCLNGKGRLCSMTDASGTTTYEYTQKGQMKKETKTIDSIQYMTQYTYDQNGNLKTMTYPSGRVITYNYSNDRAVSVLNNAASLASSINYKPFGGISSITYGNSLAGSVSYDNQYRITGITAGAGMNLSYPTYDANGNIMGITDNLNQTKNKSFTYDNLDRLFTASSTGIWGSLGWTYDGVGNRQTENTTAYTYVPGTNKLSTVGGVSFDFDNNGNTTAEGSRQFVYNQNQRLIQVNNGGTTAYYTYNGNGQRVKKNVNGTVTIFHYSLNGQIIAESDSSGNITAEYVYLNGQPLAKIEGANIYYYHNDHLGTPQKMTDASGQVVWSADYKPFGEATITISTITNNLRFPGQYYDVEMGLNYNYNRDYNFAIGRYIESDPLNAGSVQIRKPREFKLSAKLIKQKSRTEKYQVEPRRQHLFTYAWNNPLKFVDPFGLDAYGYYLPPVYQHYDPTTWPSIPEQPLPHWFCELMTHTICHVVCEPICVPLAGPATPTACALVCMEVSFGTCPPEAE